MRALSTTELLDVWEQGQGLAPWRRALLLLAAACPETSSADLARLSVGRRDARLLTLREWAFGRRLSGVASCPGCGEQIELSCTTEDIRVPVEVNAAESLALSSDGYVVRFRPPDSLDLAAIADLADSGAARRILFERCVLEARRDDEEWPASRLPATIAEDVVTRIASADPQADVQLALSCPACGHQWCAVFDIVSFFWNEIEIRALCTLRDVHTLAMAYGWREIDILALSPWRRRLYLQMVSG